MAKVIKKRPYLIERDDNGKWTPWAEDEYEGTQEATAALKMAAVAGDYRIICVCAKLRVGVETVTKVAMTEV